VQSVYCDRVENVRSPMNDRKLGRASPPERNLISTRRMRLWLCMAALLSWPLVVWHSLQARRRLKAYMLPSGERRLTLERVA